jgi:L,D-transpeptidase catalytic domain
MLRRFIYLASVGPLVCIGLFAQTVSADAARARNKKAARAEMAVAAPLPGYSAVRDRPERGIPTSAVVAAPLLPPVAVVSLGAQTLTLYSGTDVIAQTPISSGMDGYRTPTGVFSIIQKNKYHESNLYSNAPMPFMQRLTWSGIALHAGKLPGYRASHGCVRLPYDFAERLFSMTRMGARVIVSPDGVAPQAVAHASLPMPVMMPASIIASAPSRPAALSLTGGLTLASAGSPEVGVDRLLNPMQVAEVEKRRLASVHSEATQKARAALETASASARMSDAVRDERLALERQFIGYAEQLAAARNRLVTSVTDEDRVQADATVFAAEEAVADLNAALKTARQAEAVASDASFNSARVARDLENAADAADQAARLATRGTDPITVFVSRKEGKVLVRQGWQTILEGDVTFRDPQAPLGTHVFTAVAADDASALRWTAVSIADGATGRLSPTAALDRITIEPAFAAEIGKRLWTGATLIVSDQGISNETGKGTDFVVLTK